MAEQMILQAVSAQPHFEFETPAFTQAPALKDATVAIVTTAGFRHDGDEGWAANTQGYRVFDRADRSMTIGHLSPNFDRSGFVADINVMYPIDRLEEMATEGAIKAVAPRHLSFMGAQQDHTMETIRLDTGPAAAKMLKDDGVDVVLLTPV